MDRVLFVIDVQNDFVDGSLGSVAAQAVLPRIVRKIGTNDWDYVFYTLDTHDDQAYYSTREGRKLPVKHCIEGTEGWRMPEVVEEMIFRVSCAIPIKKHDFSIDPLYLNNMKFLDRLTLEIIGYATDICVVSNVLMLRTLFPNTNIMVDSSCCAGTSVEAHEAALTVMRSCQVEVY